MKAQIHIGKETVFASNRISQKNLDKVSEKIRRERGLMKMEDMVRAGFSVTRFEGANKITSIG